MKIGFIDYYIDEWHANNYPAFIKQSSFGDPMQVAMAWDQGPQPGKKPLGAWCREFGVAQARSIEEVVDKCDAIVVLSPDNVEKHEELADLPLRSGKPVYIDKPFAPSLAAGKRMFDKAAAHKTPMFSSSALRFSSALENAVAGPLKQTRLDFAATRGGGVFAIYAIHQLEMLVMAMGPGAKRVMQVGPPRRADHRHRLRQQPRGDDDHRPRPPVPVLSRLRRREDQRRRHQRDE